MEILSLKRNSSEQLIGERVPSYEIVYRNADGQSPSTVSISESTDGGRQIAEAAAKLSRGTIKHEDLLEIVVNAVEENSPAVLSKMLSDVTEAISSRIQLVDNAVLKINDREITGTLAEHIMAMVRSRRADKDSVNSETWMSLINFTESLFDNVSESVRDQLYSWMQYQIRNGRLTLTPEGKFLGYKGVKADFGSIHSGPGIVNGVPANGHLDNTPGNVIEMARDAVDDDRTRTCSTGLHVGSYDYAKSFAQGKVVLVEVDPRDVVSVPDDYNGQKIRACKYRVVDSVKNELTDFSVDFSKLDETVEEVEPMEHSEAYETFSNAIKNNIVIPEFTWKGKKGVKTYTNFKPKAVETDSVRGTHDGGYGQFKFENFISIGSDDEDEKEIGVTAIDTNRGLAVETFSKLIDSAADKNLSISKIKYRSKSGNVKVYTNFDIDKLESDRVTGIHSDGYATFLFAQIEEVEI